MASVAIDGKASTSDDEMAEMKFWDAQKSNIIWIVLLMMKTSPFLVSLIPKKKKSVNFPKYLK
jgi:hypothetical protein